MCKVLGVSKSGYYIWLKRPVSNQKKIKAKLTAKIKRIHVQSKGIYGSPKITKVLAAEGVTVSQKTVANIMKENNDDILDIYDKFYAFKTSNWKEYITSLENPEEYLKDLQIELDVNLNYVV